MRRGWSDWYKIAVIPARSNWIKLGMSSAIQFLDGNIYKGGDGGIQTTVFQTGGKGLEISRRINIWNE